MRAMVALIKREYLENRAAFVIGPAILLSLALLAALYATFSAHARWSISTAQQNVLKFYETIFGITSYGWVLYLMIMLVFYYSNAFSADRRNNSMLFWKSMPQTDLKILFSKVLAGLTIFPAAILLAIGLTGIIAYLPALTAGNVLPNFAPPTVGQTFGAWSQIMLIAIVYIGIGLLWYLPFLAWVGLLSTIMGRWAIPLSALIPLIIGFFEFMLTGGEGPEGGYVLSFLSGRLHMDVQRIDFETAWMLGEPLSAMPIIANMIQATDWISLIGGIAVATILIVAASEYRRRFVLT